MVCAQNASLYTGFYTKSSIQIIRDPNIMKQSM
jgi:hypothetical protein